MKSERTFPKLTMDRTIITLLIGLGMVSVIAGARKLCEPGMPEKAFWCSKIHWKNAADVVVAGDSRVAGAISPEELQNHLPGQAILNFGFAGQRFSPTYLDATEKLLNRNSEAPCIVLGITPLSLVPCPPEYSYYLRYKKMADQQTPSDRFFEKHFHLLAASGPKQTLGYLRKALPLQQRSEFREDGWAACEPERMRHGEGATQARLLFGELKVDPAMIQDVLSYISEWRRKGIKVFAFRPPVAPAMLAAENELSGFDEVAFRKAFEEAGGRWIDYTPEPKRFLTFDDSHLCRDAAEEFSAVLGEELRKRMQ